jgi:hypothetical protein
MRGSRNNWKFESGKNILEQTEQSAKKMFKSKTGNKWETQIKSKIGFHWNPNKITPNPHRSPLSLPHLIVGMEIEFLAHSLQPRNENDSSRSGNESHPL